jgi:BMFP domain-containing protein YqiC
MSDIVKQLLFRSSDEAGIGWTPTTVVHAPAGLLHQAADEITRLEARVKELEKMDADAATHVESVICMMSDYFIGEPPYVGWKGLGLALREDYAERDRLRAELDHLTARVAQLEAALVDLLWYTEALEPFVYDNEERPKAHASVALARAALTQPAPERTA